MKIILIINLSFITTRLMAEPFEVSQGVTVKCQKTEKVIVSSQRKCLTKAELQEKINDLCTIDHSMSLNHYNVGERCIIHNPDVNRTEGNMSAFGQCHLKQTFGSITHSFQNYAYWKLRAYNFCKNRQSEILSIEAVKY